MNRRATRLALFFVLPFGLGATGARASAPALASLFPAGGARGQDVEVTATGTFDPWPVLAWVDEPGVTVEAASGKGKFLVRVAADARPGVRLIRVYNAEGASEVRPFVVGTVPELVEAEPNDAPKEAQAVTRLPSVVNGRLGKRGDVDAFAVTLKKGQTLVAAVVANPRLGSPMDAVLQVAAPEGFVLEQVDDAPGYDPTVAFPAPADGTYHVRVFAFPVVQNSTIGFAGGDAFVYRLTLTTGPFLERTVPMAVGAEGLGLVDVIGSQIPPEARRLRAEPTTRPDRVRVWHPSAANDLELTRLPYPSFREAGPASPGEPQALAPPVAVSGRIASDGEEDVYQVRARSGQTLRLRVEAQSLGSPLDPVLRLVDESGKTVAEQDDARNEAWDVDLTAKVPADGTYRVKVRDLNRRGGDDFVYLLHVTEGPPEVAPNVAQDRFTVRAGKTIEVTVNLSVRPRGRQRGSGPSPTPSATDPDVAFEVLGLPAGVTSEVKAGKGPSRTITLTATAEAPAFNGPNVLVARVEGRERAVVAALEGPARGLETLWLTVVRP